MSTLITTTVCVDAQKPASQMVVHLCQGDSGTRTLRMIPIEGGAAIDLSSAAQAKVTAHPTSGQDLLLNCTLGGYYADLVPTPALVATEQEWTAQLVLLDSGNNTLKSLPFTILVHGSVYTGDTVEHTNREVTEIRWDAGEQKLAIVLGGEAGEDVLVYSPAMTHTHPLATEEAPGFMSPAQFLQLEALATQVDQDVSQDGEPTFAGLHVGSIYIKPDGTMENVRFL